MTKIMFYHTPIDSSLPRKRTIFLQSWDYKKSPDNCQIQSNCILNTANTLFKRPNLHRHSLTFENWPKLKVRSTVCSIKTILPSPVALHRGKISILWLMNPLTVLRLSWETHPPQPLRSCYTTFQWLAKIVVGQLLSQMSPRLPGRQNYGKRGKN